MKKYVLYHSLAENSYSFIEEGPRVSLPEDAKEIWGIEAKSWEVACLKRNHFLQWEPYKPQIANESDLRKFIPESKHDHENFELLSNLGFPTIEPVLPDLFVWIQDMNWPVARKIAEFLAQIGNHARPHIEKILHSDDAVWKYWVLVAVIDRMPIQDARLYEDLLREFLSKMTDADRAEELEEITAQILTKLTE